jgi:hypothetical protein
MLQQHFPGLVRKQNRMFKRFCVVGRVAGMLANARVTA